jgi:hypothetical protein
VNALLSLPGLLRLRAMRGTAAYGPEHAYTSNRVSTIETRIDPTIPIPFEKNINILQANSARWRSFRHWRCTRRADTKKGPALHRAGPIRSGSG